MAGSLHGKAALVTGGSRGLGACIAKRLAREGANIAITYTSNSSAAEMVVGTLRAEGRRAIALKADASDYSAITDAVGKTVDSLGRLDALVQNAGIADYVPITSVSAEDYFQTYQRLMAVNVGGVVAATAAALPHIRDGGRIIMIGSVNADRFPFPGVAIYGASKAAVAALARGWARDLAPRGILVNVIQPGPINTDLNPDDGSGLAKAMAEQTVLKRYGRTEEIAAMVAFLASDQASFITGSVIDVDGGSSR